MWNGLVIGLARASMLQQIMVRMGEPWAQRMHSDELRLNRYGQSS